MKQSTAARPKGGEVSMRNVNVNGQDEALADVHVDDAATGDVTRHGSDRI